ncbi:hypothetical protein B0T25DRAFT_12288 [Lasiosphaeria hispida]|uniref:Uncharacterized protein n=1 Tax=Lasiosphaeria hispida TaxID=260671 RepID=A0AAJ0HTR5_9PEZI|nr:hypothetical protein B0T25DRAFT_12288 [Lasiosphaeria hispida]
MHTCLHVCHRRLQAVSKPAGFIHTYTSLLVSSQWPRLVKRGTAVRCVRCVRLSYLGRERDDLISCCIYYPSYCLCLLQLFLIIHLLRCAEDRADSLTANGCCGIFLFLCWRFGIQPPTAVWILQLAPTITVVVKPQRTSDKSCKMGQGNSQSAGAVAGPS